MHRFTGSPALSEFRHSKLLSEISNKIQSVTSLSSHYIHFVDGTLTSRQITTLNRLLTYGPAVSEEATEGTLFLVTPRPGTISPWSSKATDIAHNCGLASIDRIDRGIAYHIEHSGQGIEDLSDANIQHIHSCIHDRMVEVVMSSYKEAKALFAHTEPVKSDQIDILNGGTGCGFGVGEQCFCFLIG